MATDKRLDQVSQLTDFDYALIVKGDQVAKASKQQLAELVGNLLYGATNASSLATVVAGLIGFGLKSTSLGTPGDFNTPIEVGSYYYWGNNATNAPDGFGIAYGIRIVLFSSSKDGSFEFFHSRNNKKLYIRCGHSWTSEWKEVSLS